MPRNLVLLGASHRSAPVEERERLAVREGQEGEAMRGLVGDGLEEAVLLNTCNRVELYAWGTSADEVRDRVRQWVRQHAGQNNQWMERFTYEHEGADVIRHLMRVSCSLDSLVLGEPQILGQVKRAFATAQQAGATGPNLSRLFHHAFRTAKRVRTETRIAENAVSISYAAVELARKVFGDVRGKSVLVIGAGKMGGLAVQHLMAAGCDRLHLMNRTVERAHEAAARLGGTAHGFDALDRLLGEVDIVISSTGSQHFIVRYDQVRQALQRRKYRPLFLIDIAVPRDIDPRCEQLQNVYLFDVDDLEKVTHANQENRRSEAVRAEEIVRAEVTELQKWFAEAHVVPTIVQIRTKVAAIKAAELERMRKQHPELSEEAMAAAERMAQALLNKILHAPTTSLRSATSSGNPAGLVAAARQLFALQDDETDPSDDPFPGQS